MMKPSSREVRIRSGRRRFGAGALLCTALVGSGLVSTPTSASARIVIQEEPDRNQGNELYRDARRALNSGEFARAADLFAQLRTRFPESRHVPAAFYYEAYAYGRSGDAEGFQRASALLEEYVERFGETESSLDVEGLMLRLRTMASRDEMSREMSEEALEELRVATELMRERQQDVLRMNQQQIEAAVREAEGRAEVIAEQYRAIQSQLAGRDTVSREALEMALQRIQMREAEVQQEMARVLRSYEEQVSGREIERALDRNAAVQEQERQVQARMEEAQSQIARVQAEVLRDSERLRSEEVQAILEAAQVRQARVGAELARLFDELNASGRNEATDVQIRGLIQRLEQAEVAAELAAVGSSCGGRADGARALALSQALRLGENAAAESLVEILKSPDDCALRNRRDAALVLFSGERGREEASVGDLREIYRANPDDRIRELLVWDLVNRNERQAITLMIEIAREDSGSVGELAIYGLTRRDDDRARAFLREIGRGG